MQQDPLGYVDGANRYQYIGSNPANFLDSYGLSSATLNPETAPLEAELLKDVAGGGSTIPPPPPSGFWHSIGAGAATLGAGIAGIYSTDPGAPDSSKIKPNPDATHPYQYDRPVGPRTGDNPAGARPPETQPGAIPATKTPETPKPGENPKKPTPTLDGSDKGDQNSDPKPAQQPEAPGDKPQEQEKKPSSPNQMEKDRQRGNAPRTIERIDKGNPDHNEKNHIHFSDGTALNQDGTWKHNTDGHIFTNTEKEWIRKHGWTVYDE